MSLVIEDGSVVEGANSYITLAEVKDYASSRGVDLPADDTVLEQKVMLAMDWFEGHEFIGSRIAADQPLSWPRKGATLHGFSVTAHTIPALVKTCVIQATCDAVAFDLQPSYAGNADGNIKKKKLDVIEKEFFEPTWATMTPRMPKLESLIGPLILGGGLASGRLTMLRV